MKRRDVEIMAPVGSYESLMAAIGSGADSVYFGAEGLNMRSRSSANFTLDDLSQIVRITRRHGVKSYLTVNTVLYDDDLPVMRAVVDRAAGAGVDAVIASDQAAILYARSRGVEVHISTQLNVSNFETLRFYSQWADVVVLARELTLAQAAAIHRRIEAEQVRGPRGELVRIEMFAHGALCMGISGKCYLSLHASGCSANRGACRQICRRSYTLRDRETDEEIVMENRYLLSPKDLCTIGFVDKFLAAGVRVLKIEGRARGPEYVKRVTECYRQAVDAVLDGTYTEARVAQWRERLATVFNRGFWDGYYAGTEGVELSENYGSSATERKIYVGKVTNYFKKVGVAEILVEAATLAEGEHIIVTGETTGALEGVAAGIRVDEKPVAEALQGVYCSLRVPSTVRRGDRLYKMVPATPELMQPNS